MRMQSLVHGEYPRETISLVNQLMNVYLGGVWFIGTNV
jgi:hypothetical protein